LLNLGRGADWRGCLGSIGSVLGYYRELTRCLSPRRALCEWQVADWRGCLAHCDARERFLVLAESVLWIKLMLWGFR
jgi:hypothetical protein